MKTLGAGIIGAGVIFENHARAYAQLAPRVRLVGLAEVDSVRARRSAQGFFVPFVTTDYKELLRRDDIDLVSICTPPSLHERMVIDALEAGKHVVCEKPLAHTLASADRILQAAERYPNRLGVVFQKRFTNEVKRARWLVEEGHLGSLQFGRFTRVSRIPVLHQTDGSWWGKWDVSGGGALLTQCIHELDLQLLLFGPARRVHATMSTLAGAIQAEDTLSATVEHHSGAIVSVACAAGRSVGTRIQWDVMGPDAAVHYPWAINTADRFRRHHLQREASRRFPGSPRRSFLTATVEKVVRKVKQRLGVGQRTLPSVHTPYFAAVLEAIDTGSPLPVPPDEARQSLELCVAIYTSAITHEPVELPLPEHSLFYEGIKTDDYDGGASNAASAAELLATAAMETNR